MTGFVGGGAALLLGRLSAAVLAWAGSLVVARSLSPSAWGAFSFVFGLLGLIGAMSDFQLGRSILRDLANPERNVAETTGSYVVFRSLIGVAGYGAAVTFVLASGYPLPVVSTTLVAGTVLVLGSMNAGLAMAFLSKRRAPTMAALWTAAQAVQLLVIVVDDATDHRSVIAFALPAIAYEVVLLAAQTALLRRSGLSLRLGANTQSWRRWATEAFPLAIGAAMAVVYDKLDVVMLSKLSTLAAVGLYAVGVKFATLAAFAGYALALPLSAELAESWPERPDRFRACFVLAGETVAVAALGTLGVLLPFLPHLVTALYGQRFASASTAASLVVAASSVQMFNTLLVTSLVALGRNRLYPSAALAGIVVNAILNLVLIPHLEIDGAGIATLVTETAVLGILAAGLLRHSPIRGAIERATLAKTVLAGAVASAIAEASLAMRAEWLLALATTALVYVGALQLLRTGGPDGLVDLLRRARTGDEAPLLEAASVGRATVPDEGP
jgi:O-antigen/teichoic acid export membrane protein